MKRTPVSHNQSGMIAIITTLIFMIVITLIIIGFSQVTRRNQRQALDAQLSSQAFYAAESGVNLAKQALRDDPQRDYLKSDCPPDSTIPDYAVDAAGGATITCLLVGPVNNLIFDSIGSTSKTSLIQPESGGVGSIFINWEGVNGTTAAGCGAQYPGLPQTAAWSCEQPLLRVDIVPLPATLSLDTLRDTQYTAFLYPRSSGGTTTTSWVEGFGSAKGAIVGVTCNDNVPAGDKIHKCMTEITGLPGVTRYGIRMMGLYGDAKVQVHVKDASGVRPNLVGAQVVVDSTARAVDVLKRVQARVSVLSGTSVPDFALMSNDLCKRYLVNPSGGNVTIDTSPGASQVAACGL